VTRKIRMLRKLLMMPLKIRMMPLRRLLLMLMIPSPRQ